MLRIRSSPQSGGTDTARAPSNVPSAAVPYATRPDIAWPCTLPSYMMLPTVPATNASSMWSPSIVPFTSMPVPYAPLYVPVMVAPSCSRTNVASPPPPEPRSTARTQVPVTSWARTEPVQRARSMIANGQALSLMASPSAAKVGIAPTGRLVPSRAGTARGPPFTSRTSAR